MHDILTEIVRKREADYREFGASFEAALPAHRQRPLVAFLQEPGLVLEIKRASPSKGSIAEDLDPIMLAQRYREAGAIGISVLTERRHFKGSLDDLLAVGREIEDVALLRKDFLLHEDEVDVSYVAGADVVLLIARILSEEQLRSMADRCRGFGMTPFVEVRDLADLQKLVAVLRDGDAVAGVNSRDLKTFIIDPLVPAALRDRIPCKAIYESGADSVGSCRYARNLGFEGMLIGEAVARKPQQALTFGQAFAAAQPNRRGAFWKQLALRRLGHGRPLVKVCGITRVEDARLVVSLGADLVGFIFSESPRCADGLVVEKMVNELRKLSSPPLFVGVITNLDNKHAKMAIELAMRGVLDVLQCHGQEASSMSLKLIARYGDEAPACFAAIGIGDSSDVQQVSTLIKEGEPRVLCDARVGTHSGGTGVPIQDDLLEMLSLNGTLWLAGGIKADTIRLLVDRYNPELVDVSSQLESQPGIKDSELVARFFREVNHEE